MSGINETETVNTTVVDGVRRIKTPKKIKKSAG
jgi:hypothetical protein